jgi:hypothetical protein
MKTFVCCLMLCAFGARAAEPPPPPPEPEAVRPFRRNVRLHLLSDDARVELQDATGKTVCKTPCNADVPVLYGDIALTSLVWLGIASIPSPAQDGRPVTVGSGPYIGLGVGLAIAALGGLIILNTHQTQFSREP